MDDDHFVKFTPVLKRAATNEDIKQTSVIMMFLVACTQYSFMVKNHSKIMNITNT